MGGQGDKKQKKEYVVRGADEVKTEVCGLGRPATRGREETSQEW